MVVHVNGKDIKLSNKEVNSCKKMILNFLQNVDKTAQENSLPTYYFTTLIMMQVLSQELLASFDADSFANIMNALSRYYEREEKNV